MKLVRKLRKKSNWVIQTGTLIILESAVIYKCNKINLMWNVVFSLDIETKV